MSSSKLREIAARIKQAREDNDRLGDAIALRLDALPQKRDDASQIAHGIIDEMIADIGGLERDLRQISNLPLGPSGTGSGE